MPTFSEDYKRSFAERAGVSVDELDWAAVESPTTDPLPTTSSVVSAKPRSSTAGALGRGAAANLGPSALGLAAASLGAAALTPFTGGASWTLLLPFLGSAAGGLGGFWGGQKIQEPLLTDEFKQQLAIDAEEHPLASTLGAFAPNAIALRPTLAPLKQIGQLIKAGGKGVTPNQIASLGAVGAGVGVGAGAPVAHSIATGQPVSKEELAIGALSGLLLNKPAPFLQRLPGPFRQGVIPSPEEELAALGMGTGVRVDELAFPPKVQAKPTEVNLTEYEKALYRKYGEGQPPKKGTKIIPQKASEADPNLAKFSKEEPKVTRPSTELENRVYGELGGDVPLTKSWLEGFTRLAMSRHGTKIKVDPTIGARGQVEGGSTSEIQLNPNRLSSEKGVSADVPFHEQAHILFNKGEFPELVDFIKNSEAYKTHNAERVKAKLKEITPEEYAVQNIAAETVRNRQLNEGEWKEFFKDFRSLLKTKFGNAADEDFYRMFRDRMLHQQSAAAEGVVQPLRPVGETKEADLPPEAPTFFKNQVAKLEKEFISAQPNARALSKIIDFDLMSGEPLSSKKMIELADVVQPSELAKLLRAHKSFSRNILELEAGASAAADYFKAQRIEESTPNVRSDKNFDKALKLNRRIQRTGTPDDFAEAPVAPKQGHTLFSDELKTLKINRKQLDKGEMTMEAFENYVDGLNARIGKGTIDELPDDWIEYVRPYVEDAGEGGGLTKQSAEAPEVKQPTFEGTQKGEGNIPDQDLYTIHSPILDASGRVLHPAGSTVGRDTLRAYEVAFTEPTQFDRMRAANKQAEIPQSEPRSLVDQLKKGGKEAIADERRRSVAETKRSAEEPEITWEGRKVRVISEFPDDSRFVRVIFEDGSQIAKEQADDLANGKSPERAATLVEKSGIRKQGGDTKQSAEEPTISPQAKEAASNSPTPRATYKGIVHHSAPWGIKALAPQFDKIALTHPTETGRMLTERFHQFDGYRTLLEGQIGNRLVRTLKANKITKQEHDSLVRYLWDIDDHGKSVIALTPRMKKWFDDYLPVIREPKKLQKELGMKVRSGSAFKDAGMKPEGYFPNMLDPQVAHIWTQEPGSAKAAEFDRLYLKHLTDREVSMKDAVKALNEYKIAIGYGPKNPQVEFNALRKVEGKGLPFELVEKNLAHVFMRYGRRAARDLAFFKYMQSDPKVRKALNLPDQYGHLPSQKTLPEITRMDSLNEVQAAMRSVYGIDQANFHPRVLSFSRLAANLVMGPGTAVRNLVSMPAFIAPFIKTKQLPMVFQAIAKMNSAAARAYESNAIKTSFADYDAVGDFVSHPDPVSRLVSEGAYILRRFQGRELSDKLEGWYAYTLGELLAKSHIADAKRGSKESQRILKRLGDIVDNGVERLFNPQEKVTQADITAIAKRFTDIVRGTYGPEGLPTWAVEGSIAPFTQLARFSFEKSANMWKDIIQPAQRGNFAPLLKVAFSGLLTGAAIEQIGELLLGRRGPDPTVKEAVWSGDKEDQIAKLIGLWQLGSVMGISSDFAKVAMNAYQGKSTKFINPISFPLYSVTTDVIAKNVGDYIEAIRNGDDPYEATANLLITIGSQANQTWRYTQANTTGRDESARKEKFRDLRVFNELEYGEVPTFSGDRPNVIKDQDLRKFKRTSDIGEAAELLPSLIGRALEKSKGNPEMLRKELLSIKINNYQTMPNPENMPFSFLRYIDFLSKTQGVDAANKRLTDYIQQNAINKAKTSVVPSV